MKTKSSTTLNHAFQVALTIMLLAISGFAAATEPTAPAAVTTSANKQIVEHDQIIPAGYEQHSLSDDGIPLAREDVIPVKTAISSGTSSPADESQLKISSRATDSKMRGYLARTSLQQLLTVYREANQMIDTRHVNPPSYEVRTQNAVQVVTMALNNQEFLRANNVNPQPQAIQSVQQQLQQLVLAQPARDMNQAIGLMQTTAEVVSRGTGIRREAVALEFMNGTLDSLDKYSAFMPEAAGSVPGAMLDLVQTAGLEENIVGVGVELKGHAQGVEIVGVVDNSPAAELGLQAGDVIVAIGQQNMGGKTLNDVADNLAGQSGSSVTVDILRNGQKFRGTMVRRKVYVSSVSGTKMIDQATGTGYIRLKQFSDSSATDLEKALFTLHNQGMKNLVLDLRGNPGGLLDVCVTISDMFLPSGTIVSTRGRNASDNTQETATLPKTWAVPLVVLVDDNSASASEIFAAAVQENQRGIVVGRTSYGKGTVQTHFPMTSTQAILKLTTAKFYSPKGREMAGAGVTPDVPVAVETSTYRGTDNDADVQTAMQLISRGAPSQLLAGNLNRGSLNVGQNGNLNVNILPSPTVNFPANYPQANQVPAGLKEY
ncbi:S41 family peptidase [Planctomicrobium piriforme]|uniref:Carboxyl-terminal processing protease n=1 Tax=Planctomicrobium piriforme TaxID=1576369 RepID=A0A1I3PUF7_9PLAN|nr:S41 family peptidase [Planctomicrobium piriforme]SFJ25454.1 carboxyl-terminal processing protease [Planctomicrobium piriforme]